KRRGRRPARPRCAAPSRWRTTPTRSPWRRVSFNGPCSPWRAHEHRIEDARRKPRGRAAHAALLRAAANEEILLPPGSGPLRGRAPRRERLLLVPEDDARPGPGRGTGRARGLPNRARVLRGPPVDWIPPSRSADRTRPAPKRPGGGTILR